MYVVGHVSGHHDKMANTKQTQRTTQKAQVVTDIKNLLFVCNLIFPFLIYILDFLKWVFGHATTLPKQDVYCVLHVLCFSH